MEQHDLLDGLRGGTYDQLARDVVLGGVPKVFGQDPAEYDNFRAVAATLLSIPANDIRVVGSAHLGYSLSPDTFGTAFTDTSDVDIVVAHQPTFDQIWWTISKWAFPFPNYGWPDATLKPWFRHINGCFNGWIEPTRLRTTHQGVTKTPAPLRDVRLKWFDAMKRLANHASIEGRDCEVRIYRTLEHAHRYHSWSLSRIST